MLWIFCCTLHARISTCRSLNPRYTPGYGIHSSHPVSPSLLAEWESSVEGMGAAGGRKAAVQGAAADLWGRETEVPGCCPETRSGGKQTAYLQLPACTYRVPKLSTNLIRIFSNSTYTATQWQKMDALQLRPTYFELNCPNCLAIALFIFHGLP